MPDDLLSRGRRQNPEVYADNIRGLLLADTYRPSCLNA